MRCEQVRMKWDPSCYCHYVLCYCYCYCFWYYYYYCYYYYCEWTNTGLLQTLKRRTCKKWHSSWGQEFLYFEWSRPCNFFLAFLLAFYLAHILTFYLPHLLAFYLETSWHIFWQIISHFVWHFLMRQGFFNNSIWHFFWHTIWHVIWHVIWHSSWHIFWHSIWRMFWHIFWRSSFWQLRSGSAHCDLELAVEARRFPLRSGAGKSLRRYWRGTWRGDWRRDWRENGQGGGEGSEEGEGVEEELLQNLTTLTWQVGKKQKWVKLFVCNLNLHFMIGHGNWFNGMFLGTNSCSMIFAVMSTYWIYSHETWLVKPFSSAQELWWSIRRIKAKIELPAVSCSGARPRYAALALCGTVGYCRIYCRLLLQQALHPGSTEQL